MEMNVKIESPQIERTTSSHVSTTVVFLMLSDVLISFILAFSPPGVMTF